MCTRKINFAVSIGQRIKYIIGNNNVPRKFKDSLIHGKRKSCIFWKKLSRNSTRLLLLTRHSVWCWWLVEGEEPPFRSSVSSRPPTQRFQSHPIYCGSKSCNSWRLHIWTSSRRRGISTNKPHIFPLPSTYTLPLLIFIHPYAPKKYIKNKLTEKLLLWRKPFW